MAGLVALFSCQRRVTRLRPENRLTMLCGKCRSGSIDFLKLEMSDNIDFRGSGRHHSAVTGDSVTMSGQFYCAEGYESIPLGNNSYLLFVPGSTKRYFATLPL